MTHTTKEGKVMWIADMTDTHLVNTILMLFKNQSVDADEFMTYVNEAARRQIISVQQYQTFTDYAPDEVYMYDVEW